MSVNVKCVKDRKCQEILITICPTLTRKLTFLTMESTSQCNLTIQHPHRRLLPDSPSTRDEKVLYNPWLAIAAEVTQLIFLQHF